MVRVPFALSAALVLAGACVLAPAARADRLELADGRWVEGLVEKTDDGYRVVSRFGETTLKAADVKTWVTSKPVEVEWRERLAALAADDHQGRADLAKWLLEAERTEAAEALAKEVLEIDCENATAHGVLGHVRHAGRWMTPDEAKRAEGLEEHGGKWYTHDEWLRLTEDARAEVDTAEKALAHRRIQARLDEAVRLMLAPDKALRALGEKRLLALSEETGSPGLKDVAPRVRAYAEAADRMVSAWGGGGLAGGTATVLAEARIQFARLKRPIQNFTTGLASNLGGGSVTIQLPELEIIKVNSTVLVPAVVER